MAKKNDSTGSSIKGLKGILEKRNDAGGCTKGGFEPVQKPGSTK